MIETCCGYIGAYARCDGREDSMTKTKEMMSFHFIKVRKVARGANLGANLGARDRQREAHGAAQGGGATPQHGIRTGGPTAPRVKRGRESSPAPPGPSTPEQSCDEGDVEAAKRRCSLTPNRQAAIAASYERLRLAEG